jgi:signal transduction histidine kinase/CheY-like chemotaxis protein
MPEIKLPEKRKILIVDDEEVIRSLLSRILEEKGYFVEFAEDGNKAFEKIKMDFFNLLITDLKMPKLDGLDILKEIKKVNPFIEVIIVTGYPTIESAVEAIKIGAFDFICKPFDLQEIKETVDRCFEKQKFGINYIELGELMTLFEISKAIPEKTSQSFLLGRILDSALAILKAKKGSILLLDEKTQELSIKVARGLNEELIHNTRIRLGEGIAGSVAKEGKIVLVADADHDSRFQINRESRYETKSFLSLPLISKYSYPEGSVLGVINITDKISGESFTEREQTLLSVLGGEAVAAIENYKLYAKLQDKIGILEHIIKELDETQNLLIQSEKMAAVGQLASGIAHEIRNPLATILMGMDALSLSFNESNIEEKNSVEMIKQSVVRANNIIVDLLQFSRTSQLKAHSVKVGKIMDDVVSLIRNKAFLNNVQINKDYRDGDISIEADANMLQQAFLNLCINAIEAMPNGGQLTLNIYTEQKTEKKENNAVIEVIDTGQGIPEEILLKIFNPFFTTKEPGQGTGLGLSIVHMIIERHKGTINVESRLNSGTKFTVKLPVAESSNTASGAQS